MSEAKALALRKRYQFWTGKMNDAMTADDTDGLETATKQMSKIEEEAKVAGVSLAEGAGESPAQAAAEGAASASTSTDASPVAKKSNKKQREAAVQERAAQLASGKAKTDAGPAAKRIAKPKKEKTLAPCLDGCGASVPGNFQMGHDAKLKSMILKIERGDMEMDALPEIAQELVGFKKGEKEPIMQGGKKTGDRQLYVCTKAPVRFQGRPEITLTTR